MPIPDSLRAATIDGIKYANQALRELKLESETWVDAFAGILRTDALFMLRPLDGLYGAYLPGGARPGILVNSKHPLALQRFTAAHELGHLWMKHGESLDTENEILGRATGKASTPVEIAAHTFAAFLLMPRAAVLSRIADLNLTKSDLRDPRGAYLLSLWFGVSYLAMVWHLSTLKQISRTDASNLAIVRPKFIKEQVLGGDAPEDPWADVWSLTLGMSERTVVSRVGDEFAITVPSHAASGYLWYTDDLDRLGFKLVDVRNAVSAQETPRTAVENTPLGAAPPKTIVIQVLEHGLRHLELEERRPFGPASRPACRFSLEVIGVQKPAEGVLEQPLIPVLADA